VSEVVWGERRGRRGGRRERRQKDISVHVGVKSLVLGITSQLLFSSNEMS